MSGFAIHISFAFLEIFFSTSSVLRAKWFSSFGEIGITLPPAIYIALIENWQLGIGKITSSPSLIKVMAETKAAAFAPVVTKISFLALADMPFSLSSFSLIASSSARVNFNKSIRLLKSKELPWV